MARLAWIALLATCMGLGAVRVSLADEPADDEQTREDTGTSVVGKTDAPPLPPAYEGVLPSTTYVGNLLLLNGFDVPALATLPPNELEVDFLDNSTLGRLKRIRSLSLLTLSDQGSSRLFLGVNEEGLLGLHFAARPGAPREDLIEIARLPNVEEDPDDR